jgi:hypothetical protein
MGIPSLVDRTRQTVVLPEPAPPMIQYSEVRLDSLSRASANKALLIANRILFTICLLLGIYLL